MPIKGSSAAGEKRSEETVPLRLGPRLAAAAALTAQALAHGNCRRRLADIGSDHAYLPAFLLLNNIIDWAVAVDVHEGPYHNILRTIGLWSLEGRLEARKGNGFAVLNPGEADVIVVAGMGGGTIIKILDGWADTAQYLILQPQNAYEPLGRFLLAAGWTLTEERLAAEGQEIYRLMLWRRGKEGRDWDAAVMRHKTALWKELACPEADEEVFSACVWRWGHINIDRCDGLLQALAYRELERLTRACAGLSQSERRESVEKRQVIAAEINVWEGLLKWLFP